MHVMYNYIECRLAGTQTITLVASYSLVFLVWQSQRLVPIRYSLIHQLLHCDNYTKGDNNNKIILCTIREYDKLLIIH